MKILQPAFYAREDTKTPLRCALWSVAANTVLSVALFFVLDHVGIALATALAAWLNAILLGAILWRRSLHRLDERFTHRLPRILVASVMMGVLIWAAQAGLAGWFDKGFGARLTALTILIGAGLAGFAAFALLLRAARASELKELLTRSKA